MAEGVSVVINGLAVEQSSGRVVAVLASVPEVKRTVYLTFDPSKSGITTLIVSKYSPQKVMEMGYAGGGGDIVFKRPEEVGAAAAENIKGIKRVLTAIINKKKSLLKEEKEPYRFKGPAADKLFAHITAIEEKLAKGIHPVVSYVQEKGLLEAERRFDPNKVYVEVVLPVKEQGGEYVVVSEKGKGITKAYVWRGGRRETFDTRIPVRHGAFGLLSEDVKRELVEKAQKVAATINSDKYKSSINELLGKGVAIELGPEHVVGGGKAGNLGLPKPYLVIEGGEPYVSLIYEARAYKGAGAAGVEPGIHAGHASEVVKFDPKSMAAEVKKLREIVANLASKAEEAKVPEEPSVPAGKPAGVAREPVPVPGGASESGPKVIALGFRNGQIDDVLIRIGDGLYRKVAFIYNIEGTRVTDVLVSDIVVEGPNSEKKAKEFAALGSDKFVEVSPERGGKKGGYEGFAEYVEEWYKRAVDVVPELREEVKKGNVTSEIPRELVSHIGEVAKEVTETKAPSGAVIQKALSSLDDAVKAVTGPRKMDYWVVSRMLFDRGTGRVRGIVVRLKEDLGQEFYRVVEFKKDESGRVKGAVVKDYLGYGPERFWREIGDVKHDARDVGNMEYMKEVKDWYSSLHESVEDLKRRGIEIELPEKVVSGANAFVEGRTYNYIQYPDYDEMVKKREMEMLEEQWSKSKRIGGHKAEVKYFVVNKKDGRIWKAVLRVEAETPFYRVLGFGYDASGNVSEVYVKDLSPTKTQTREGLASTLHVWGDDVLVDVSEVAADKPWYRDIAERINKWYGSVARAGKGGAQGLLWSPVGRGKGLVVKGDVVAGSDIKGIGAIVAGGAPVAREEVPVPREPVGQAVAQEGGKTQVAESKVQSQPPVPSEPKEGGGKVPAAESESLPQTEAPPKQEVVAKAPVGHGGKLRPEELTYFVDYVAFDEKTGRLRGVAVTAEDLRSGRLGLYPYRKYGIVVEEGAGGPRITVRSIEDVKEFINELRRKGNVVISEWVIRGPWVKELENVFKDVSRLAYKAELEKGESKAFRVEGKELKGRISAVIDKIGNDGLRVVDRYLTAFPEHVYLAIHEKRKAPEAGEVARASAAAEAERPVEKPPVPGTSEGVAESVPEAEGGPAVSQRAKQRAEELDYNTRWVAFDETTGRLRGGVVVAEKIGLGEQMFSFERHGVYGVVVEEGPDGLKITARRVENIEDFVNELRRRGNVVVDRGLLRQPLSANVDKALSEVGRIAYDAELKRGEGKTFRIELKPTKERVASVIGGMGSDGIKAIQEAAASNPREIFLAIRGKPEAAGAGEAPGVTTVGEVEGVVDKPPVPGEQKPGIAAAGEVAAPSAGPTAERRPIYSVDALVFDEGTGRLRAGLVGVYDPDSMRRVKRYGIEIVESQPGEFGVRTWRTASRLSWDRLWQRLKRQNTVTMFSTTGWGAFDALGKRPALDEISNVFTNISKSVEKQEQATGGRYIAYDVTSEKVKSRVAGLADAVKDVGRTIAEQQRLGRVQIGVRPAGAPVGQVSGEPPKGAAAAVEGAVAQKGPVPVPVAPGPVEVGPRRPAGGAGAGAEAVLEGEMLGVPRPRTPAFARYIIPALIGAGLLGLAMHLLGRRQVQPQPVPVERTPEQIERDVTRRLWERYQRMMMDIEQERQERIRRLYSLMYGV